MSKDEVKYESGEEDGPPLLSLLSEWTVSGSVSDTETDTESECESVGGDEDLLRVGTWNIGQGMRSKLQKILSCCAKSELDIVGLQEVGDPVNYSRIAADFGYQMLICSEKHAGVALLVSMKMTPFIRQVLKSGADGRMVGVSMESGGRSILVVSVYMPTGLDRVSGDDDKARMTDELYSQLLKWCRKADKCILLGDFNETRSPLDRSSTSRATTGSRWLQCLEDEGLTDVYRHLHPTEPGFTHFTNAVGGVAVKSRLDYVWMNDIEGVTRCQVSDTQRVSHHRLLYCEMKTPSKLHVDAPRVGPRLPNLRAATEEQKNSMVHHLQVQIEEQKERLLELGAGGTAQMNELADTLSSMTLQAAMDNMKLTRDPSKPFVNSGVLQFRRRLLARIWMAFRKGDVTRCKKLVTKVSRLLDHRLPECSDPAFADAVEKERYKTRRLIKDARRRLDSAHEDQWNVNRKAAIHRMLNQERPSQTTSIVDPVSKTLEVDPDKLKSILYQGFAGVFDCPEEEKMVAEPPWYEEMYVKPKTKIKTDCYKSLMAPTTEEEVLKVCSSCKLIVAPGEDRVSAGIWRVCAEQSESVRWALTLLFNACFRLRKIPASGKRSIIVPILKKPLAEKTLSNVRPISLQNALTKLLTKMLATRLGAILAENRILHPAQEGFLKGGASFKCIDSLLDAWEHSKEMKTGCFTLFYDIKAAYDSVRKRDLIRSLHRISLPQDFIDLVEDSLSGLTSRIRTVYGPTAEFAVKRSVRQGDPLSPLLFIIFIDALHVGLEKNPLYGGAEDGYKFSPDPRKRKLVVASKGFADDTVAVSRSNAGLKRQNDWVHAFAEFNHLELHPDKTQLVGREETTNAAMKNEDILVAGKLVAAAALDECITYLGVHMCMDLCWNKQIAAIGSQIGWYCHVALKNRLSVPRAVYFLNVYLIAKIEYGLRYSQTSREQIAAWDKSVVACVCNLAGMPRKVHPSIAALVLNLRLPSQQETAVKVSEAFLRLNDFGGSLGGGSAQLRWDQGLSAEVCPVRSSSNRLVYVNQLCAQLGWSMKKVPPLNGRRGQWKNCPYVPAGCAARTLYLNGKAYQLVFNFHGSFGSTQPSEDVMVFTDGSASLPWVLRSPDMFTANSWSTWGVCYANDWFNENWRTVPPEDQLAAADVFGALLVGDPIAEQSSRGIYMAELQAVVRALMSLPVTWNVTVVLDSKSSMLAVEKYTSGTVSTRAKLRMSGRPMLDLLKRLIDDRYNHGGSVRLVHVKSHTDRMAPLEVGNRCADFVADRARALPTPTFEPLRLELGERWLYIANADGQVVYDDVRRTVLERFRFINMDRWKASRTQCTFAADAMVDLCSQLLQPECDVHSDRGMLKFMVSVASDTLQYVWVDSAASGEKVQQRCCAFCVHVVLDVQHVLTCPSKERDRNAFSSVVIECLKPNISDFCLSRVTMAATSWPDLVNWLFELKSDDATSLYLAMIGAFSRDVSYQMLCRVGVKRRKAWKSLTCELREKMFLQCFVLWKSMC